MLRYVSYVHLSLPHLWVPGELRVDPAQPLVVVGDPAEGVVVGVEDERRGRRDLGREVERGRGA